MDLSEKSPARSSIDLHVPAKTYLTLIGVVLLTYVAWKLAPLMMLFFLAVLLAVTIEPLLQWFGRKKIPRWAGVLFIAVALLLLTTFFLLVMLPPLIAQISLLVQKLPEFIQAIKSYFPEGSILRKLNDKAVSQFKIPDPTTWMGHVVAAGEMAVGGLAGTFLLVVFTLYLLTDGHRTYVWLTAFLSDSHREKLRRTVDEVSPVIFSYVAGQVVTSVICGLYTFVLLAALEVPAALALGVLAGFCDVLPVIGFFISMVPALVLALGLSGTKALTVLGGFIFYHAIENYILVPKVYGNRLRLSDLVVIVALLIGGAVAGIMGAIVVLPIVASYPIIERIWLVRYLGRAVITKHAAEEKILEQEFRESTLIPPEK